MEWYHINRRMLVYKAWYFFSISAMTVAPFLSLHLKQYGMSPSRIGLLTFIKTVCVAMLTPIIGVLMDTFRCPKLVVVTTGTVWIASVLVVGFMTPQPQQESCEVIRERLDYEYDQCSIRYVVDKEDPPVNEGSSATQLKSFRHVDHYGVEKSIRCQSLNETLSTDRTWLYTSDSLQLTFYIFVITFGLVETSFQALISIADAESLNALEDMGIDIADYGNQRAFGSLGWAITPVLYGLYITYTRNSVSICGFVLMIVDYSPMFWAFLVMAIITMIIMAFFSLEYKTKSSTSADEGARQVLCRLCTLPRISVIIVLTFTGMCNGTAIGYVYWHIDNINGNELLMGLMSTCHGVSEVVIGFASGALIRQFGYFPLIIVGTLTYLFRFIFYAFVTEPWWFMVTEIFHSLSFILSWNVTLSYLSLFIPEEYRTSLAMFLNSIANGLGASIGYLLSGYLIEIYGTVIAFEIYAGMCAVVAILGTGVFLYTTSSHSEELQMQPMKKYERLNDSAIGIQQKPSVPPVPEYLHEYQQPTYDDSSDVSSSAAYAYK